MNARARARARRFDPSLSEQTPGLRLLHDGPDKGGGTALLSQGAAYRAGARGGALRHRARDLPAHLRQSRLHARLARDDSRGEAPADRGVRALRDISLLHRLRVRVR